jgi:hypothetical protein
MSSRKPANSTTSPPPCLPPTSESIADCDTQAAFDAWTAGAAGVAGVAHMVTECTLETVALKEKLLSFVKKS